MPISPKNPEREAKAGHDLQQTGRQEDAYKMYEELLYSGTRA